MNQITPQTITTCEYAVLSVLAEAGPEMGHNFKGLASFIKDRFGYEEEVRDIGIACGSLRMSCLVKYVRNLFDYEENQTAGSGYSIEPAGIELHKQCHDMHAKLMEGKGVGLMVGEERGPYEIVKELFEEEQRKALEDIMTSAHANQTEGRKQAYSGLLKIFNTPYFRNKPTPLMETLAKVEGSDGPKTYKPAFGIEAIVERLDAVVGFEERDRKKIYDIKEQLKQLAMSPPVTAMEVNLRNQIHELQNQIKNQERSNVYLTEVIMNQRDLVCVGYVSVSNALGLMKGQQGIMTASSVKSTVHTQPIYTLKEPVLDAISDESTGILHHHTDIQGSKP